MLDLSSGECFYNINTNGNTMKTEADFKECYAD
jgi:hypothetical protein